MNEGGLLEKAMQMQPEEEPMEAMVAEISTGPEIGAIDSSGVLSEIIGNKISIGIGMGVIGFALSWVLSSPDVQSEYASAGLIPLAMLGGSFLLIAGSLEKQTVGIVAVAYLTAASSPFIASSVFTSSITVAESSISSDSSEITLKVRQSGGLISSSLDSAEVSISFDGEEVWSVENQDFSIDREDGIGKYGLITLTVSDFYSGNSVMDMDYIVSVKAGSSEDSYTLDSSHLIRTVDDSENEVYAYMGTGSDCNSDTENCVLGVILTSWVGLKSTGTRPGGIPLADFNLSATLVEGGSLAVQYPTIRVSNGLATWDDSNEKFGEGSISSVGSYGSELPLDGSISAPEFERMYIPLGDFETSGDFGCYSFEIEVSQSGPWSDSSAVSSVSHYEYAQGGTTSNGGKYSESWTPVNSC